jgi:AbrB family looped-hinge helix DNA binding protein
MKVSERGQIAIPKTMRKRFGLNRDVEVELMPINTGILIRKRSFRTHPVNSVLGILNRPSITDEYIEQVRGK